MCIGAETAAAPLRVLHLVGSSVSMYYYNLSLMYARLCADEPEIDRDRFQFRFVVVHPDGTWSFPESLSEGDMAAVPQLSKPDGLARLAADAAATSVVVPHMFCYAGMTTYRALFDLLEVPYIGCSAECMAIATDKDQTKAILEAAGVNVPRGQSLTRGQTPDEGTQYPVVLKPAREDNSLGVVLVNSEEEFAAAFEQALQYDDKVICEQYIAGREVRCAMLEEADGSLTQLPMTEYFVETIRTSAHKLATNDAGCPLTSAEAIVKTDGDRQCPAVVPDHVSAAIRAMAAKAHTALGCTDFSLYDIRINEDGVPFFLEACNFCSFSPMSSMVSMANAADRPHPSIFHNLLERAAVRGIKANTETRVLGMR